MIHEPKYVSNVMSSASIHTFVSCDFSYWKFHNIWTHHHTHTHTRETKLKTNLKECNVARFSCMRSCCALAHWLYAVSFITLTRCQNFPDALALWCGLNQCCTAALPTARKQHRLRHQATLVFHSIMLPSPVKIKGFLYDPWNPFGKSSSSLTTTA